jgi:chemotaxis protein CheY-P-specific phosphatase CheC
MLMPSTSSGTDNYKDSRVKEAISLTFGSSLTSWPEVTKVGIKIKHSRMVELSLSF